MPIDPKTTALLLIEYQNDFTTEGGVLHNGVKAVMESTNMLANTQRVASEARAAGVTVMFAPISFAKGYREITSEPYGILKGVVDANAFVRGGAVATIPATPSCDRKKRRLIRGVSSSFASLCCSCSGSSVVDVGF